MIKRFHYKDITWVDLENPTEADVDEVMKEYGVHPVAANELVAPSSHSKLDVYEDFIYTVLHFPKCSFRHSGTIESATDDVQEVDFIIGTNVLITTHYELVSPLHEFSKIFGFEGKEDKGRAKIHAGFMFFYIVRELYRSIEQGLDFVNASLKRTEREIFADHEKEMVGSLSTINKTLLDLRWALKPHREILHDLVATGREFFDATFARHVEGLLREYEKIWGKIETNKETLVDLRETNDSLLATKTNEIVKTLTVLAIVIAPSALVAQLFGVSSNHIPLLNSEHGFWIVVLIALGLILATLTIFKSKRWI